MIAALTRRPGFVVARNSRDDARRGKGGLALPGSGKHDHGDRGPGSSRCRLHRILRDAAARASIRAAAIGGFCPQADRAFRFVVRHRARRMRFQIAGARTAGRARQLAAERPPEVRIRRPARALLTPQRAPDCEFRESSDLKPVDPDQWERLKLAYERQCYRDAEQATRKRLARLQAASLCRIEPVAHSSSAVR